MIEYFYSSETTVNNVGRYLCGILTANDGEPPAETLEKLTEELRRTRDTGEIGIGIEVKILTFNRV